MGTLREQGACPMWEDTLRHGLSDVLMPRLVSEASLGSVWAKQKGELDASGFGWSDVLNFG